MKTYPLTAVVLLILLQGMSVAPRLQASGCELTTNCIGSTLSLCESNFVMFPGVTYTYQWFRRPVPSVTNVLAGETNACLNRVIESTDDAGWYQVIITGTIGGESVSNTLCGTTVIVREPILAASFDPTNRFYFGSNMEFCMETLGAPPQAVNWRKNGALLPNQTNLCLTLNCYRPSDAGAYSMEVFGPCNSSVSQFYLPPPVLAHSLDSSFTALVSDGEGLVVSETNFVMVAGVSYSYQWYRYNVGVTNVLAGQTNLTLILSNVTFADQGFYSPVITASACGESLVASRGGFALRVLPKIQNPRILPDGIFEFTCLYPGPEPFNYRVFASSDPTRPNYFWDYLGTATAVGGGLYRFTDPLATNHARRFYRLE